jgi:hypothetical protein
MLRISPLRGSNRSIEDRSQLFPSKTPPLSVLSVLAVQLKLNHEGTKDAKRREFILFGLSEERWTNQKQLRLRQFD